MCKDLCTFFPYDVAQAVHVKQHATSVTTYCAHSCWQLKNKLCYTTAKEDTENCGTGFTEQTDTNTKYIY